MITRRAVHEETTSQAWYSACLRYRYGLERRWHDPTPVLLFIMLNPSTADEHRNDPTIARCEARARRLGYGGVRIANLFAFRATRPADLRAAADPVGPENDALMAAWSQDAALTVAAWGVHGTYMQRDRAVRALLCGPLVHLGLTQAGHPRHPLYVRNAAPLTPFTIHEPIDV